jgi:hypothetical protein
MSRAVAVLLLIAGIASAETPIKGLTLQGNGNAGGYIITNLGADFAQANGLFYLTNSPILNGIPFWNGTATVWAVPTNLSATATNEVDPVALPIATNAATNVTLQAARILALETAGHLTHAEALLLLQTGRVDYASSAGWIVTDEGRIRFGLDADDILIYRSSNTYDVSVNWTNGLGEGVGPSLGTVWTNAVETVPGTRVDWDQESGFNLYQVGNMTAGGNLFVDKNGEHEWSYNSESNAYIAPSTDHRFRLAFVTVTNLVRVPIDRLSGLLIDGQLAAVNESGQAVVTIAPSNYILAVDSLGWLDAGPWVNGANTNGNAIGLSLGLYGGYPWQGCYTAWTNGQQGRVYVASIPAPSFDGAKLSGLRFKYRAYNAADSIDVLIYQAGAAEAFATNTLTCTNSETVHTVTLTGFDIAAAPGFTAHATVKSTAETTAGSWTAIPRVEPLWSK